MKRRFRDKLLKQIEQILSGTRNALTVDEIAKFNDLLTRDDIQFIFKTQIKKIEHLIGQMERGTYSSLTAKNNVRNLINFNSSRVCTDAD